MQKTVVVGLSGGVDSSVAALLLKQQGYNVVGIHMKGENPETAKADEQRVKEVASSLGIECVVVDFQDHMKIVKDYFISEYLLGRTPNPCVVCNKEVKFKPFLEHMKNLNADYFATGHYAVVEHVENAHHLKKAKDEDKDQSYFLCQLNSEQISKALFPLGELTKQQVRKIAEENNLITSNTKDSYDVCFLGSQKFKDYMSNNHPEKNGKIIDVKTNKVVGTHTGISKYTTGQRKGLNIGGQKGFEDARWFVVKKDVQKNILYVSCGEGEEMFSSGCVVKNFNWLETPTQKIFSSNVKLRYRQKDQITNVTVLDKNTIQLNFNQKQKAVSIGQFAVLYADNGTVIGGGTIEELIN